MMHQVKVMLAQWQVDKSDIPPLQEINMQHAAAGQLCLLGCSMTFNPILD